MWMLLTVAPQRAKEPEPAQRHHLEMQTRCSELVSDFPSGKTAGELTFKSASK